LSFIQGIENCIQFGNVKRGIIPLLGGFSCIVEMRVFEESGKIKE